MKRIMLGFVLLGGLALVGCQQSEKVDIAEIETTPVVEVTDATEVKTDVVVETNGETVVTVETKVEEGAEPTSDSEVKGPVVPRITYYHGAECPHCHNLIKYLPTLEKMYPGMVASEYEVWHSPENAAIAEAHLRELGEKFSGVPAIVIEDEVLVGFNPEALNALMEKHYGAPVK